MNLMDIQKTVAQLDSHTNRIQFEKGRESAGSTKLGKDAFLTLLMTQLKYQDPINPVDDKEFISQQALFTQIEKLDDINATLSRSSHLAEASSLVGKKVDIQDEEGKVITGRVTSVALSSKGLGVKVGAATYPPEQIIQIYSD